jgi:hypothetical protein
MPGNGDNVTIEGARLIFPNFSGREGQYNAEGDRNFGVILSDEAADELLARSWPVKSLKVRDEGEPATRWVPVSIKYKGRAGTTVRPPTVVFITSRGRTNLDEDTIDLIDQVDIANVDLILRPYPWAVNGKTGIKIYLKAIYVTLEEDVLSLKYRDVKEVDASPEQLAIGAGGDDVIDVEWTDGEQLAIER